MIDTGTPAPEFCLPGTAGFDSRVYRLQDCIAEGPALLAFYPAALGSATEGDLRMLGDLAWFEFLNGVHPYVVARDDFASVRQFVSAHGVQVPVLNDSELETAREYGVVAEGGSANSAAFLVNQSGVVERRWTVDSFSQFELGAILQATKRATTAPNATTTTP